MERVKRIPKDQLYKMASWEQREYEKEIATEETERIRIKSEFFNMVRGDIGERPGLSACILMIIIIYIVIIIVNPHLAGVLLFSMLTTSIGFLIFRFIPKLYMYYFTKLFR